MQKEKIIDILKNVLKTLIVFGLATALTYFLSKYDIQKENLLLVYILAVVVVIIETRSRIFGLTSALLFVAEFEFLFVTPIYSFKIFNRDYYPTLIIFLMVAVLVSMMAHWLKKQSITAKQKEKVTKKLYEISKGLLNISGIDELLEYGEQTLSDITGKKVEILYGDKAALENPFAKWCYENSCACGFGESEFPAEKHRYVPIRYKKKTVGVVSFDCSESGIDDDLWNVVSTVISQISLSVEREVLSSIEEKAEKKQRNERIKTNLIRSLAHDLQTPLTGISSGAKELQRNIDSMSGEQVRESLNDINNSIDWLCSMVENLFNMTMLQSNEDLNMEVEPCSAYEILKTVSDAMSPRAENHDFIVLKPEEDFYFEGDKQLLSQALNNAVDNAFRHTKCNCDIILRASKKKNKVIFEVEDNGGGIDEDKIDRIFESFYSVDDGTTQNVGIGLSVSKYIVEQHAGTVSVTNNHNGGVTFTAVLPVE